MPERTTSPITELTNEELYRQFGGRVYNTALAYLQQVEEAEELTQDVFVEVFLSRDTFKGASAIGTWIYRITTNKCLDVLRYRNRKKRVGKLLSIFGGEQSVDIPHFDHPGAALDQKENISLLFAAIDKLPERQKSAFLLNQHEGLPVPEVAEILQLRTKAVESLIQRAKANLRTALEKHFPDRMNQRN